MSEEVSNKVREMAKLTVLSNRISEVQEKNIKMYPFIFFENITSAEISYDLSRVKTVEDEPAKSGSIVSYYLTLDESKNNHFLDKRFSSLERAVRDLFWNDIVVEVYFNDKIAYKSKKNG